MRRKLVYAVLWMAATPLLVGGVCNRPKPDYGPKPLVYAVTPAEQKTGKLVWIRGEHMDNTNYIPVIHNSGPPMFPEIVERRPSFIVFRVPSGIPARAEYLATMSLKTNHLSANGEPVPGKSHHIFLRPSGPVPGHKIRFQFVNAGWAFLCDENGESCVSPPFHDFLPFPADHPNDWGVQPWYDRLLLVEQSVRDWSTMCSEAWQAPTIHSKRLRSGFLEYAPRTMFNYNPWFWLEVGRDIAPWTAPDGGYLPWTGTGALRTLASGWNGYWYPDGDPVTMCDAELGYVYDYCGVPPDTVVVAFVGAFRYYGEEIDPNDPINGFVGIASTSWYSFVDDLAIGTPWETDTHGMILLADSPWKGYFPDPRITGSIAPLLAAVDGCHRDLCWPGAGGYSAGAPINVLTHELYHVLTDRGDYGFSQLDVEDTPAVNNPSAARRGLNLNIPAVNATPQKECRAAHNGHEGKDFVHEP